MVNSSVHTTHCDISVQLVGLDLYKTDIGQGPGYITIATTREHPACSTERFGETYLQLLCDCMDWRVETYEII